MVEAETVRSLLDSIERRVTRLEEASETPLEDYLADFDLQDIVERRLEAMTGFRNVLAHEYASVVPELVHEHLERLDDIRAFIRQLLPRLEGRGFA